MAAVYLGNDIWLPTMPRVSLAWSESSTTAMTATGHKAAFVGNVWNMAGATKTLVGVGLCFGTITKAGGSGLTIGQEGVSGAASPFQPDGTAAQTWAVASGSSTFASNTWHDTSDNAGVSVAFGQAIAIVVQYDGSGRLGSDSVTIRGLTSVETGPLANSGTVYHNGTAWQTTLSVVPNLVLKFSDGTYGTLKGAIPHASVSALTFNSGSAADEAGIEFTLPAPVKVDALGALLGLLTAADYSLVLYSGTTALATASADGDAITGTGNVRFVQLPIAPQSLAAGTYRLMVKPTTVNSVGLRYYDLALAAHRQAVPGLGEAAAYTTRVDAGSFAAVTTTRVPMVSLEISHVDDGTGGGGGGTVYVPAGGVFSHIRES